MSEELKEILEALDNSDKELEEINRFPLSLTKEQQNILFKYINTLEEENKMYAELKDDYENRIDEVVGILTSLLLYDTSKRSDTGLILVNANKLIEILKGDGENENDNKNIR